MNWFVKGIIGLVGYLLITFTASLIFHSINDWNDERFWEYVLVGWIAFYIMVSVIMHSLSPFIESYQEEQNKK